MSQPLVYLAGPIHGCSDEEAFGWRGRVTAAFAAHDIATVDPTLWDFRGREDEYATEIVESDKAHIRRCTHLIVNHWKLGAGTCMEQALAYLGILGSCKTVVAIAQENISPWIREHAHAIVQTEDEAVEFILDNTRWRYPGTENS